MMALASQNAVLLLCLQHLQEWIVLLSQVHCQPAGQGLRWQGETSKPPMSGWAAAMLSGKAVGRRGGS